MFVDDPCDEVPTVEAYGMYFPLKRPVGLRDWITLDMSESERQVLENREYWARRRKMLDIVRSSRFEALRGFFD